MLWNVRIMKISGSIESVFVRFLYGGLSNIETKKTTSVHDFMVKCVVDSFISLILYLITWYNKH